jgi:hypothetical protein
MIATGPFYHIQPSSYMPASVSITHAVLFPIGAINLYVGFTSASDPSDPPPRVIPLDGPIIYDNIGVAVDPNYDDTQTLLISGDDCARSSDMVDDADSTVPTSIVRSEVVLAPEAEPIVATSVNGPITLVSNASDFDGSA